MAEKSPTRCSCCLSRGIQKMGKNIKLILWHPLNLYLAIFVGILLLGIIGLLALIIGLSGGILSQVQALEMLVGMCFSIILSVTLFFITLKAMKNLEYDDSLKKLLKEIGMNKERLDNFVLNIDNIFSTYKSKKEWNWIDKTESYTNWASGNNFQFEYFPSTAYFNFVNKGYILYDTRLKIPKRNIASIYESFQSFNVHLQYLENKYHNFNWDDTIDEHNTQKNILVSFDFHNKIINFQNIDDIHKFLKSNFINFYLCEYVNGGIKSNYEVIKNELIEYYDFEAEVRKDKSTEKEDLPIGDFPVLQD